MAEQTQFIVNWDSMDEATRVAYAQLITTYQNLKTKLETDPDEYKSVITGTLDVLEAKLAEIRAAAIHLEADDPAQLSFFPKDSNENKKKEIAEHLIVVNLVQNEVTNRLHGVLSKNITTEQIMELEAGVLDKIESRDHVLTYNKFDKLLKISDREGFDVFVEGLDAIANVQRDGKKRLPREIRQTAAVLFDRMMIAMAAAGTNEPFGGFSLREYMDERGLSDEKSLRQQIERDLDIIYGASINFVRRGKSGDFRDMRIISDKGIKNGIVFYEFTRAFFDALLNNKNTRLMYMQFPVALLKAANIKNNPWAYFLGRRAALHRHMNRGHANENIIGIDTLLAACPDFPTLKEVMASSGNITRRIIEPFERDMNAQIAAYTWEYQDGERPKTGKDFMAANVIIHWKDKPELASPLKSAAKKTINKKATKPKSNTAAATS